MPLRLILNQKVEQKLEKIQQIQLTQNFSQEIEESIKGIIKPKDALKKILKDSYLNNKKFWDKSIMGENIFGDEILEAILKYENDILKLPNKSLEKKLFQKIAATTAYHLNLKVNSLSSTELFPEDSKETLTELIKYLKLMRYINSFTKENEIESINNQETLKELHSYITERKKYKEEDEKQFKLAILKTEQVKETMKTYKYLIENYQDTTQTVREYTKMQISLNETTEFRYKEKTEHLSLFEQMTFFTEILFRNTPQIQYLFIKDYVYKTIRFKASDRVLRRFTSSVIRRKPTYIRKEGDYDLAFVNTIGEFILISMGVISEEIFTLRRYEITEKQRRKNEDLRLKGQMQKLGLKTYGTVFFNRFHTLNEKPSPETDQLVREFITQTVRSHQEEIITQSEFYEFLPRCQDYYTNLENSEKRKTEELREVFKSILLEIISKQEFQEYLADLISSQEFHNKIKELYNI